MTPSLDDLYRAAIRLHQQGRGADAAQLYDTILAQAPHHAGALHLKGVLALQGGDYDGAIALIQRSLDLVPQHSLALSNLGVAYRSLRRYDEAIVALRKAVELDPNSADALANLGQTLVRAGQIEDAVVFSRRALALDPKRLGLQSSLLFSQNYLADSDPVDLADRAREVGKLIEAAYPARTAHPNGPDPDRKLRVGLVSGDLRGHPVGRFLSAVLARLDPAQIELFAYSNSREEDGVTDTLRSTVSHWLNVTDMKDAAVDAQVVADQIDILVDLSGHTGSHRLFVFAKKPAPVSFSWIGYFATTGLTAIDYVLASKWVIPEREQNQWVEQVWRLPDTYLCFTEPRDAPEPKPLPALANGHVTFGCFNNFNKLSDATLVAWQTLLSSLPQARLILRSSGHYHDGTIPQLRQRLAAAGIDVERVRIDGKIRDYAEHLASYDEIDIALDPFPYNGGTTTVEALYMGVPVLACAGDRYVAHMAEGILHNAGFPEWIAPTAGEYAPLGVRLAGNLAILAALRASLREQMLASPLFDAPRFAGHFEQAMREMWLAWCAAQRRG